LSDVELCRFSIAEAIKVVQSKRDEFVMLGHQEPTATSELTFRDEKAIYWNVGPESMNWRYYGLGSWHESDPPVGMLEAPFALDSKPPPESSELKKVEPIKDQVELLESVVGRAREGYEQGRLTSLSAESLITRVVLIDRKGNALTVGIHSGDWYSFSGNNWVRISRPDSNDLLPANDATFALALKSFESSHAALPEQVTFPWNPPPTNTTQKIICSKCNTMLPSDSQYCERCGVPITPVSAKDAPLSKPLVRTDIDRVRRLFAPRVLMAVVLSVGISTLFPYSYYLLTNVTLNWEISLVTVFILGFLLTVVLTSFRSQMTPSTKMK